MEKLYECLKENKGPVRFLLGSLLLWLLVTAAALAITDYAQDRLLVVRTVVALSGLVPALLFAASGICCRLLCKDKLLWTAAAFLLELAESAMPLLFILIELRLFWDYPPQSVYLQAGISAGAFLLTYAVTAAITAAKNRKRS
ncbi:MAG: hypothetical protein HUJ80_08575 [Firmicutes bacterium]|nr:hypothetical protein [Bacillota bacterium]